MLNAKKRSLSCVFLFAAQVSVAFLALSQGLVGRLGAGRRRDLCSVWTVRRLPLHGVFLVSELVPCKPVTPVKTSFKLSI